MSIFLFKSRVHQVGKLGSDTMVNAFACNFKLGRQVARDVVKGNFLQNRMSQRLSVRTMKDDPKDRPMLIMRTEVKQTDYLKALDKFKSRIGLSGSENQSRGPLNCVHVRRLCRVTHATPAY